MAVQSALGENLRAEIDVTSITPEEASSLRVRDCAARGLPRGRRRLRRRAAGHAGHAGAPRRWPALPARRRAIAWCRSRFVDVILELSWASGRLVREYTMLLDPPSHTCGGTAAARRHRSSPAISAAPPACAGSARRRTAARAACRSACRTRHRLRRHHRARAPRPAAPAAAPAAAGSDDEYRVRTGDTLYSHRQPHAARRCLARPDAGRAVAQQLAGLHRQQHESAEGGLGAGGAFCEQRPRKSPRPRPSR